MGKGNQELNQIILLIKFLYSLYSKESEESEESEEFDGYKEENILIELTKIQKDIYQKKLEKYKEKIQLFQKEIIAYFTKDKISELDQSEITKLINRINDIEKNGIKEENKDT